MDLLGSILNSMQKPPVISGNAKAKELAKKQEENLRKMHEEEKVRRKEFRDKIEAKVDKFVESDEAKLEFEPMEKVLRAIVHDVAEIAGLPAFSFGIEDVDRRVVLYKKETVPSDEELSALKKGIEYDPEKEKQKRLMLEEEESARATLKKPSKRDVAPKENYKDKYKHLIGEEAGKTAAQLTTPNKQFGFVPSENKKDQRSIEQTLADIREKKKRKTEHQPAE